MPKEKLNVIRERINKEANEKLEEKGYLTLNEFTDIAYKHLGVDDPMKLLETFIFEA